MRDGNRNVNNRENKTYPSEINNLIFEFSLVCMRRVP